VQRRLLAEAGTPRGSGPGLARDRVRDGLARQALLALSSDWAFMVSKESAADYARSRAHRHADRVIEISDLLAADREAEAAAAVARYDRQDNIFGQLDARSLAVSADRTEYAVLTGR
jgi:1,4-alpha-glucan branching enzyme